MKNVLANHGAVKETYAGVSRRLSAYILDCLLLAFAIALCQAALYIINPLIAILRSGHQPTPNQVHAWVFATVTIPSLLYFALTVRSSRQATVGMRLLKLKVADVHGNRIGFAQALLRSAVLLIPFELNHIVIFHLGPRGGPPSSVFWLGIAGMWMVTVVYLYSIPLTRRRQSVHDLVAGTVVLAG